MANADHSRDLIDQGFERNIFAVSKNTPTFDGMDI
jgi:hypothetical protein